MKVGTCPFGTTTRIGSQCFRARLVPKKNLGKIFFGTFMTLIRSIKHTLVIKLITQMYGKSRDKSIKPN